jgi:hypothetical protein
VTVDKNASTFSVTAPATFDADTKEGEATILISDGVEHTIVRTVLLSLASGVTTINLTQAQFVLDVIETETEEQADLSASMTLIPSKATAADLDFESSDQLIAEVDAAGIITAKSEGQVTITVKSKANAAVSKTVTVDVLLTSPGFTIVDGVVTAYSGPGGALKVPSKATAIGDGVNSQNSGKFQNNTTITSIDLNNVVTLGINAFKSATALVSVNAPNLEYVREEGFHGASNLVTVNSPKLMYVDAHGFQSCTKLETIDLSNLTELRGQRNFRLCPALDNIDLSKLTVIVNQAFNSCSALTSVDLSSVTTLSGQDIFRGCSSLTSVDLASFEGAVPWAMFWGCAKLVSVNLPKATAIGGTDWSTANNKGQVFADCNLLTELDLPEVTILTWRAINALITGLNVPKVTHLGPQALGYLTSLTYLSLPSVVHIGTNQFQGRPGPMVLDLSDATELATVEAGAFPDQDGVEIYVATPEIAALFPTTYTKTTVTVGKPPVVSE